jgi:uridylate kinase
LPHKFRKIKEKIIIGAGYQPGRSSDYAAAVLAKTYGAHKVVNLSNIDYVCDKDPRKFPDAKKISALSWADFQKIVGLEWMPGKNAPFDPIAAQLGRRLKLQVAILNGHRLHNLKKYFNGQKFIGTVIK